MIYLLYTPISNNDEIYDEIKNIKSKLKKIEEKQINNDLRINDLRINDEN